MKLQIIFLASTLALTFSKNIPQVKLNRNTKGNLNKLANNAENFLADKGVTIDLDGRVKQASQAVQPQVNAIKNQANQLANQFGDWDLGQIIDAVNQKIDSSIDKAEAGAPDGAKTFIDIGQDVLKAFGQAGKKALDDNQNLTVDDILKAGKQSVQQSLNGQQVNSALRKANKAVQNN